MSRWNIRSLALFGATLLSGPVAHSQVVAATRFGATSWEQLGQAIENTGDLDGDGLDDIAARRQRLQTGGLLRNEWVVLRSADLSLRYVFWEPLAHAESLRRIGDLDLDGFPEIAVAFPYATVGGKPKAGILRIYSGATGVPILQFLGDTGERIGVGSGAGSPMADAGDIDQDGVPDIAYIRDKAPGADAMEVRFVSGSTSQLLSVYPPSSWNNPSGIQPFVDIDGDGSMETLISFWLYSGNYLTAWSPALNAGLVTINGDRSWDFRPIDDFTFDGVPEVALFHGSYASKPYTLMMHDIKTDSVLWSRPKLSSFDFLGVLIGRPGDVNLDGFADLPVSQYNLLWAGHTQSRVLSGVNGADLVVPHVWENSDYAGQCTLLNDVIGDGRADLVVGALGDDPADSTDPSLDQWGSVTVVAHTSACGSIVSYGHPCPTGSPYAPTVTLSGCAGSPYPLRFAWKQALPNAVGILVIGQAKAQQPFAGCWFRVGSVLATVPWPTHSGFGEVDLPSAGAPAGLTLTAQLLVPDPSAPFGVDVSNAVEVKFP